MTTKPLGVLKDMVESAGMAISYAYEDLVFLDHNSFLLQFTDSDQEILVHINSAADQDTVSRDISTLQNQAINFSMRVVLGEIYTVSQDDDETIRIEFGAPIEG